SRLTSPCRPGYQRPLRGAAAASAERSFDGAQARLHRRDDVHVGEDLVAVEALHELVFFYEVADRLQRILRGLGELSAARRIVLRQRLVESVVEAGLQLALEAVEPRDRLAHLRQLLGLATVGIRNGLAQPRDFADGDVTRLNPFEAGRRELLDREAATRGGYGLARAAVVLSRRRVVEERFEILQVFGDCLEVLLGAVGLDAVHPLLDLGSGRSLQAFGDVGLHVLQPAGEFLARIRLRLGIVGDLERPVGDVLALRLLGLTGCRPDAQANGQ